MFVSAMETSCLLTRRSFCWELINFQYHRIFSVLPGARMSVQHLDVPWDVPSWDVLWDVPWDRWDRWDIS